MTKSANELALEALKELVACKDLKEQLNNLPLAFAEERFSLAQKYDHRKTLAWQKARESIAVLSQPQADEPVSALQSQPSDKAAKSSIVRDFADRVISEIIKKRNNSTELALADTAMRFGFNVAIDIINAEANKAAECSGDPELHLREMLAWQFCGASLYLDDGELQDGRAHPIIDFKRDSPAEISRKMQVRSKSPITDKAEPKEAAQDLRQRFEALKECAKISRDVFDDVRASGGEGTHYQQGWEAASERIEQEIRALQEKAK